MLVGVVIAIDAAPVYWCCGGQRKKKWVYSEYCLSHKISIGSALEAAYLWHIVCTSIINREFIYEVYCIILKHNATQCCSSIYHHAVRRDTEDKDEDGAILRNTPDDGDCTDRGVDCDIGQGQCLPGLICTHHHYPYGIDSSTCEYYSDGNTVGLSSTSSFLRSGSSHNNYIGGHTLVFITLGLLGVAIVVLTITVKANLMRDWSLKVQSNHRYICFKSLL